MLQNQASDVYNVTYTRGGTAHDTAGRQRERGERKKKNTTHSKHPPECRADRLS